MTVFRCLPAGFWRGVIFACALVSVSARPVASQSACTRLLDRLDDVLDEIEEARNSGGAADPDLDDARRLYQSLSCGSYGYDPACQDLRRRIARLEAQAPRGLGALRGEKQRIEASLRAAGCGDSSTRRAWDEQVGGARNPQLFEELYREQNPDQQRWYTPSDNEDEDERRTRETSGTFRTLCVRACDGYYWPLSFSTRASYFKQDEQACRAACPGQTVELYIHRNPGQQSQEAVSLKGEPYMSLPKALAYRTKFDKSCTCHAQGSAALPAAANTADEKEKESVVHRDGPELTVPQRSLPPSSSSPPVEHEVEIIRTPPRTPIIVTPQRSREVPLDANGLRGVSPE